jgi:hypothetical protein
MVGGFRHLRILVCLLGTFKLVPWNNLTSVYTLSFPLNLATWQLWGYKFHQVAHGEQFHGELTRYFIGCLMENTLKYFVVGLTVNYLDILSVISLRKFAVFYILLTVRHVAILGKWPTWRTILFYVFIFIFNSLNVSSTSCSSSGETNCVNTTSGNCHSVSVAVSCAGRK